MKWIGIYFLNKKKKNIYIEKKRDLKRLKSEKVKAKINYKETKENENKQKKFSSKISISMSFLRVLIWIFFCWKKSNNLRKSGAGNEWYWIQNKKRKLKKKNHASRDCSFLSIAWNDCIVKLTYKNSVGMPCPILSPVFVCLFYKVCHIFQKNKYLICLCSRDRRQYGTRVWHNIYLYIYIYKISKVAVLFSLKISFQTGSSLLEGGGGRG